MEKYTPPFTITNEMLSLVSSISEKVGKRIMEIEHGKFYKNNYIGMYRFYAENETDD